MTYLNPAEQEERDFTYATPGDWDREEARELGQLHPEQCWILTDRDVWHRNPNYTGPDQPHPELAQEDEYYAALDAEAVDVESCDVVEMDESQLDVNHDVDFYDC